MSFRSKILKAFYLILVLLISDLLFSKCANPINPTGGPKDTIPPTLTLSIPVNGSVNFEDQTIMFEFSERISADRLKENLIITPKTEINFKHVVKRNRLTIKLEEPLPDSTTFSFNFFDGVVDITEKNPVVNLILALSTGTYIDSMTVSGNVRDLLSQEPSTKFIIGLYPTSDTLDFLAHSPTYFTSANDSGDFTLSYVKTGDFRILAFNDANRNLTLDPKEEEHGFLSDTLLLYDSIQDLRISTLLQNVEPIKIINNRPIRTYHEIRFSREVQSYSFDRDSIISNITGDEQNVLRIYNREQFSIGDTTRVILTVSDSLNNQLVDTIKLVFSESPSRPSDFKTSLTYKKNTLTNDATYKLSFSKPILFTDTSKLLYAADTSFQYYPDSISITWNHNLTRATMQTFGDTISIYQALAQSIQLDTLTLRGYSQDSIQNLTSEQVDSLRLLLSHRKKLEFRMREGAFISVEDDTTKLETITHRRTYSEPFGTLKLNLVTDKTSFSVQLLDAREELAYELRNQTNPVFNVKPANYKIRILIDSNEDGKWSFGNLLRNEEPEEVFLFPETISIRENWIVEDISISF